MSPILFKNVFRLSVRRLAGLGSVGLICLCLVASLLAPVAVQAQSQGGVTDFSGGGFTACNITADVASNNPKALESCVREAMRFALVIAGVVALMQLAIAAFNYYNPEVSTSALQSSIDTIKNVFIGLMLIAGPILILNTFNPSLINLRFLGFTSNNGTTIGKGSNGTTPPPTASGLITTPGGNFAANTKTTATAVQTIVDLGDKCLADSAPKVKTNCLDVLRETALALNTNSKDISAAQVATINQVMDKLQLVGIKLSDNEQINLRNLGNKGSNLNPGDLNYKSGDFRISNIKSSVVTNKVQLDMAISYLNSSDKIVTLQVRIPTTFANISDLIKAKSPALEPFLSYDGNSIQLKASDPRISLDQFTALCRSDKMQGCASSDAQANLKPGT